MDRMPLGRNSMMGMMGNPMSSMFGSSGGSSQPFSLIGNMDMNNVGMGSSSSSMGMGSSQGMMSSLPSGLMGMGMSGMSVMDQMAKEAEMRRILESDIEMDRPRRGGRQDYGNNRRDMDMFDDRVSPRSRSGGLLPAPEIPPLISNMGQRRDMRGNRGRDMDRGRMDQRDMRDRRDAHRREEWRRNDPSGNRNSSRVNRGEGRRDGRDSRGRSDSSKGTGTSDRSNRTSSPGSSRKRHSEEDTKKDAAKAAKKEEGDTPSESKAEGEGDGDKAEKEPASTEDKKSNYCLTCDVTFEGTFIEHRNGPEHKSKVDHDSKNFCRTCEVNFEGQFLNHRLSNRHKDLMAVFLAQGCAVCGVNSFTHYMKWKDHMNTINHKRLEKRALAAQRIAEIEDQMDTTEAMSQSAGVSEAGSGEEDAASDKDGFKQPKSPGMKDTGGEVDKPSSEVAIGQEFVVQVTGYFCKLCHKFYTNETAAKVTHCQTQSHYVRLQKYISSKLKPAPSAAAKPAAKPTTPAAKSSSPVTKSSGPAKKPNKKTQKKKEETKSDAVDEVKEVEEVKETDEKKEEETETEASSVEVKNEAEVEGDENVKTEEVVSLEKAAGADNEAPPSEDVEAEANGEEAEEDAGGEDNAMETSVAKDPVGDDNDEDAEVPEEDGDEAGDLSAVASKKTSPKKRQVSKRGRKVKK